MTVFVFGHRNPDTDAICSALAYADFLRRTTRPDAVAACCGTPNQRTEFALRKAGLQHPKIIMDIRPEIEDVCNRQPVVARHTDVFYEVYQRMNEHEIRAIPVLGEDDQVVGIVTLLGSARTDAGTAVSIRYVPAKSAARSAKSSRSSAERFNTRSIRNKRSILSSPWVP